MDITLKINADFQKATEAFNQLANESEETRKKMEEFSKSLSKSHVDDFNKKQKELQIQLTGTRGETAALQQSVNNYQREIERLVKSGLSPEHEAIQKLANEQQRLKDKIKESNDIQKMQNGLMKTAEKAALACYAAIGAGIAAVAAMTQKTAEMGDELAKTSKRIGISVEALQELEYAAKQNGVKDFRTHLDKLSKTMGDVKSNTGTLTKYLQENDGQLLGQLQNVKSNEEAFTLLMDSISKAPDEFTKAKLATEYFGKSGRDLIVMANEGADGIEALREEAKKYGIMSSEAAKQSELYMDAQTRLKAALTGVQTELTSKLLPGITQAVNGVANFIASIDNWEEKIKIAGYALAGLTAGLTAFLLITKGAAAIKALVIAFKALNAAIAANPIGAIAIVITAVLIPALIYLIRNWDTVQTYLQQGIGRLEYAFKWLGSVIKEKLLVAFSAVKAAGATLIDFIYGNIIRAVGKMLEVMGKLPYVGEHFQKAANAVKWLGNTMGDMAAEARNAVSETIKTAKEEQRQTEETLKAKLKAVDEAANARRNELKEKKQIIDNEYELEKENTYKEIELKEKEKKEKEKIAKEINKTMLELFRERLENTELTEKQETQLYINEVKSFLEKRAALETDNHADRIAFLEQQRIELSALYEEGSIERIAIEKAADETILKSKQDLVKAEKDLNTKRLQSMTTFFSGYAQLLETIGEKNRGFAIMAKSMSSAEALINTYLAATKALASAPPPYNYIAMAGVLATGLAQQIKIVGTPIPSAETGGRFIVPDNSSKVDDKLFRFNGGEEINVTPRGMTGQNESFNLSLIVDGQVFADMINKQVRKGEIYTLQLAGNL